GSPVRDLWNHLRDDLGQAVLAPRRPAFDYSHLSLEYFARRALDGDDCLSARMGKPVGIGGSSVKPDLGEYFEFAQEAADMCFPPGNLRSLVALGKPYGGRRGVPVPSLYGLPLLAPGGQRRPDFLEGSVPGVYQ